MELIRTLGLLEHKSKELKGSKKSITYGIRPQSSTAAAAAAAPRVNLQGVEKDLE